MPYEAESRECLVLTMIAQSIDLGAALEKIAYDDSTAGQTFELYGPKEYTMRKIADLVDREIYKKRRHINVPKPILKPVADVLNKVLWWHTLSADEVEREFIDQVIDPEAKTFKDLDIEPSDIASFTYHYLVRNLAERIARDGMTDKHNSKDSEARTTMICRQPRRRRGARRRSTSMSWMSCKEAVELVGGFRKDGELA